MHFRSTCDPNLIQTMREHEQAVASIDDEIEALMRTVRQLQYKKFQHQKKIKECKGRMTLARRLPPEILATIFEECVRDGWTRTPLMASHVCSEWRIAANVPSVWSHVYVNCDAKDPQGRTRFWLKKSRGTLLRVTIDVRNDASQLPGVMKILLQQMPRWRVLNINTTLLWQVNYILTLCNRPAPELCVLDISIVQEFDDTMAQTPMEGGNDIVGLANSFPQSPHFHTLRINRNILPSHGTLPLSITDLSITLPRHSTRTKLSVDKLLHVLGSLQHLQSFSLVLLRGQEREFEVTSNGTRSVVLSDLTTLIVVGSRDTFAFLPHLLTPALTRLHLRSSLDPLGYPDEQMASYIRRFVEQGEYLGIEILDLHDIDLSMSDFSTCLARSPRLRDLRLHESEITDSIIKTLNGAEGYCPLLKRLDLRWCGHVTGRALIDLVESRLYHIDNFDNPSYSLTAIDRITVINCAFVGEQDVIRLAQTTTCQVVMEANDYCRMFGCCQNERYRRRLQYHCAKEIAEIIHNKSGKLVF
ncbi:hypothetical protein BDZ94DRAFT_1245376 [Collybia nuda]|uniref:F-box domain-containing protein n=1 Tax=Collybia nuda TaxID=64659 RepID=A0A9P5YI52_9AGAR|nr:hypothetical protein BDZ94DRAFT_1245376 [Collybia nuda]